jgi:hypothetical protein
MKRNTSCTTKKKKQSLTAIVLIGKMQDTTLATKRMSPLKQMWNKKTTQDFAEQQEPEYQTQNTKMLNYRI